MLVSPTSILIFGGTGALARTKILPALNSLLITGIINKQHEIIVFGRKEYGSKEEYLKAMENAEDNALQDDVSDLPLKYMQVDLEMKGSLEDVWPELAHKRVLAFMAVNPEIIEPALARLEELDLTEYELKIITEKPFATSLESAKHLNNRLEDLIGNFNIFRNDHYLHKPNVQALRSIRDTDVLINDLIERDQIKRIRVLSSEKDTLGSRAEYFDKWGIIVDMVHSHMLQILAVLCADIKSDVWSFSKSEFMDSLKLDSDTVQIGQYQGYVNEAGLEGESDTTTFASMTLTSDYPRWKNTKFQIVVGKGLAEKKSSIQIDLVEKHPVYGDSLTLELYPGGGHELLEPREGNEYGNVILAALLNNQMWFVTFPEMISQWRLTEKILKAQPDQLMIYPQGLKWEDMCLKGYC